MIRFAILLLAFAAPLAACHSPGGQTAQNVTAANAAAGPTADQFANQIAALPEAQREDATLALSELVTNAFRHAQADAEVGVEVSDGSVRITVTDRGPGRPETRPFVRGQIGGHGLRIVRGVANEWGTRYGGDGAKTVWFAIDAARRTAPREERGG